MQKREKANQETLTLGMYDPLLRNYSGLFMEAQFAECGEWGGHRESLKIKDSLDALYLTYKVYPFNCDSIYYYSKGIHQPISSKTRRLDRKDIKNLTTYITQLCQSSLTQNTPSNSGEVYTVKKADSTLIVNFYGYDKTLHRSYQDMVKDLFP